MHQALLLPGVLSGIVWAGLRYGEIWLHQGRQRFPELLDDGHRLITYDPVRFGKSSQPATGCDHDTFAADLHALMEVEICEAFGSPR